MRQSRTSTAVIECVAVVVTLAAAVLLVVLARWASALTGIPFESFSRDPVSLADLPTYTGVLSNVGVVAWHIAASIALLSGAMLHRLRHREAGRFLAEFGGLTLLLAVDDLFLVHESLAPFIGVSQHIVVGGYVITFGGLLVRFRSLLRATPISLLLLSCLLFTVSLGLDQFSPLDIYLVEDGAKLVGIVAWLLYLAVTSMRWLEQATSPAPAWSYQRTM